MNAQRVLTEECLRRENLAFAGTRGVSVNNRSLGFLPAFRDNDTGRVEIARLANGRPATMHVIEGLPHEWAVARIDNRVCAVKSSVVAGFVRDGVFYTREEAAAMR